MTREAHVALGRNSEATAHDADLRASSMKDTLQTGFIYYKGDQWI